MIWVIGGTKDSRDFLEKLITYTKDVVVTTATEYGGKLLENLGVKVVCKRLTPDLMLEFIDAEKIDKIVDLSHPYAVEVSSNALAAAQAKNVEYFRFEREEIPFFPEKYKMFTTIDELINHIETLDENILVTLGSNNIPHFNSIRNLKNCFFRILPKWDMVKRCEDNGILPKNIIAMQGPFTKNMNKAMIEQFNIKYLVTKQAGATGGEKEKIEAAEEMGIEVLYLSRPHIDYPNFYQDIDELIQAVTK